MVHKHPRQISDWMLVSSGFGGRFSSLRNRTHLSRAGFCYRFVAGGRIESCQCMVSQTCEMLSCDGCSISHRNSFSGEFCESSCNALEARFTNSMNPVLLPTRVDGELPGHRVLRAGHCQSDRPRLCDQNSVRLRSCGRIVASPHTSNNGFACPRQRRKISRMPLGEIFPQLNLYTTERMYSQYC